MKKSALGRGLDALFPQQSQEGEVMYLPLSQIDPNPDQPRKAFDPDALEELSDSVKQLGVLQPILVCPQADRYRIIAGERRFRAAMQAGLATIPAFIRTLSQHEQRLAALTENLQRSDLNPMDAALAVRLLMDEGSLTQEEAAQKLGKSRPAIANLLRLLNLSPQVQELVREGKLTEGHARVLAGIPGPARQLALAEQTILKGLSVRALEELARKKVKAAKPASAPKMPEIIDFQERMQEALGVRAQVVGSLKKGRIVLKYASFEELQGIYEAIDRLLEAGQ